MWHALIIILHNVQVNSPLDYDSWVDKGNKTKWLLVWQEARTQSGHRWLGSVTLARSRVRVRAGYKFVSCRRYGDQRLPAGLIATA